ncbi:MAG: transposase [Lentisphaerales bacterium]|nr:transposase [Lentisphaerales bacterium]
MGQEFENNLWRNRGYLPHYDATSKYQMITYRLADSLPQKVLHKLKEDTSEDNLERRKSIEEYLDRGYGSCILSNPEVAQLVIENWYFFHYKRYDLVSYVVMPNHVHILIKIFKNQKLSEIIHSWKSYTANQIRETLGAGWQPAIPGTVWQKEYWDRFIRDENHLNKAISYILNNPVKAGLVAKPEDWPWSSVST